jgi:uncharacterized protein (DUF2267 family)
MLASEKPVTVGPGPGRRNSMSMGLSAYDLFDEAIQKTQVWLNDLAAELDWDHPAGVLAALRAALHALRDRIPVAEAAHLGAQLPLLIRGLYYEGWRPAGEPWKERHREPFLCRVEQEMRAYAEQKRPEAVVRALFRLLGRHVSEGEVAEVKQLLPAEIRELWP